MPHIVSSYIKYRPLESALITGYPVDTDAVRNYTPTRNQDKTLPDFFHQPAIPFAQISIPALEQIKTDIERIPAIDQLTGIVFESDTDGNTIDSSYRGLDISNTTIEVAKLLLRHAVHFSPRGSTLQITRLTDDKSDDTPSIPRIHTPRSTAFESSKTSGILAYPYNIMVLGSTMTGRYSQLFDDKGNLVDRMRANVSNTIHSLDDPNILRAKFYMYPTPEGQMNLYDESHTIHCAQQEPGILLRLTARIE
jgi:hypothetical protein